MGTPAASPFLPKYKLGMTRWISANSAGPSSHPTPTTGGCSKRSRTLLPKLALHPALSPAAHALFEDSAIVIPDGATLRKAVDTLKGQNLLGEDADVKGDLFEILVNDLGTRRKPRSSAHRAISSASSSKW